jgi:FMN-dependent NADH-azoreductase
MRKLNFAGPTTSYVRGVFAFIGITDFSVIAIGSRAETPELANAAVEDGLARMDQLSAVW